jgi:carbon-monoxide dehydrogenase large subunit
MKHAAFVRSPHAHAKVKGIDTSAALAMPGVDRGPDRRRAGRGRDRQPDLRLDDPFQGRLADEDGRLAPLARRSCAMSARRSRSSSPTRKAQARDAADAVVVDYEELAGRHRGRSTRSKDGAPQLHPEAEGNLIYDWEIGDEAAVNAAFDKAAHVTRMEITNNRLVPNAMEPRAALGRLRRRRGALHALDDLAEPACGPPGAVRVLQCGARAQAAGDRPDVGGGFGSKIYIYPEEIVCLWAAKRVGVPVKWVSDRTEAFLTDAHGRDHRPTAEMALDADNRITRSQGRHDRQSRRLHVAVLEFGADLSLRDASVGPVRHPGDPLPTCDGLHQHRAGGCLSRRGPSGSDLSALERTMETAARELGLSPADLRRKNFIREFPHQTPVIMCYDAGDYDATLDAALKAADYDGFAARKAEAASPGKLRGIGMSCYIEACGIAPSAAVGSLGAGVGLWESAEVRVNPVGTIEVLTGSHSHGQGHETTFAQLSASASAWTSTLFPSSTATRTRCSWAWAPTARGPARSACRRSSRRSTRSRPRPRKIAAHLMEADEGDIVIENGELKVAGTDKKLSFTEVALAAYTAHNLPEGMEPGLKEGAFYDPTNFTFPAGTYVCEVEVDPETGKTEIANFVAADDFGNIINPMIVEGQVHGGITQGIGQALLEGTPMTRPVSF